MSSQIRKAARQKHKCDRWDAFGKKALRGAIHASKQYTPKGDSTHTERRSAAKGM